MKHPTERRLRCVFDIHQHKLPGDDEAKLLDGLEGLQHQVANFPVADLHVMIEGNARSNDVSVRLALVLPGTTLIAQDHEVHVLPAFERALSSLIDRLQAHKDFLGNVPRWHKHEKGAQQEIQASAIPDVEAITAAVAAGDYAAFRSAIYMFEEPIRKRVGRWIQRYPDFEVRIGHDIQIDDVVEDVFLLAFESYDSKPREVAFGDWLESFLDPAVNALRDNREDELEIIQLARSARAVKEDQQHD